MNIKKFLYVKLFVLPMILTVLTALAFNKVIGDDEGFILLFFALPVPVLFVCAVPASIYIWKSKKPSLRRWIVFYPLITGCVAGVCYALGELMLPSGLVGVDPKYFGVAVFLAMLIIAYPYGLVSMIFYGLITTKSLGRTVNKISVK